MFTLPGWLEGGGSTDPTQVGIVQLEEPDDSSCEAAGRWRERGFIIPWMEALLLNESPFRKVPRIAETIASLPVCSHDSHLMIRVVLSVLLVFMLASGVRAGDLPVLRTIAEITRLSPEEAQLGYPVELRGMVVTFSKPEIATLFIHDGSHGIFVSRPVLPWDAGPVQGDIVDVTGFTEPGNFAASIKGRGSEGASVRVTGHGPMIEPKKVYGAEFGMPGRDCDWVSVEAQVIEVTIRYGDLVIECQSGTFPFFILLKGPLSETSVPWGLAEKRVRARGVVASSFNSVRQMTRRFLRVSTLSEIETIGSEFEPQSPTIVTKANELFRLGGAGSVDIVRLSGVSTYTQPGRGFYLQTGDGSIWIQTAQPIAALPGTVIEVEGRPMAGEVKPFLRARSLKLEGVTTSPEPKAMSAAEAIDTRNDSELVVLEGTLLDIQHLDDGEMLELRDGRVVFRCLVPWGDAGRSAKPGFVPGSDLRVTGVVRISASGTNDPMQENHSLMVLARSRADIRVLSLPPYWTAEKVTYVAVAAFLVMLAFFGLARVRRRREDETRRREFEAVLVERGRFAREIHDSLAQGLTSISLQLECVPDVIETDPVAARHHVEKARGLVSESLKEARRTIWNLRPLALGEADLASALRRFTNDLGEAGRIIFSQEIEGTPRHLPPEHEAALLRIAQEAITNAVRYASPGRVNTRLRYGSDWFTLIVSDDGRGFDVTGNAGKGFGLTSMAERVAALDGSFTIESSPGKGTEVSVTLTS